MMSCAFVEREEPRSRGEWLVAASGESTSRKVESGETLPAKKVQVLSFDGQTELLRASIQLLQVRSENEMRTK